jgi:curli biogenesis system outer membrane secretion channel CsgG
MRIGKIFSVPYFGSCVVVALLFGVGSSTAFGAGTDDRAPSSTSSTVPALVGPKRSVVVDKFDAVGSFTATYGAWDVGGGLAAMLTTALSQSGQFVVLERANVDRITYEQQLKANKVVNPETGPELFQVSGAQFIIIGSVTEFGAQDKGGGINIGLSGQGNNPLNALLGTTRTEGAVAIDMRIVDTTTTQVVQTVKVREPFSNTSVNVASTYKGIALGGNEFMNTPLGEATRHTIDKAVAQIIATAARQPWQAQIVDYDGKEVVINAGGNSGVKKGDHFNIERISQRFTDPATGEVLSTRKRSLGTLDITNVEDKVAFGNYTASNPDAPKRGDLVVQVK